MELQSFHEEPMQSIKLKRNAPHLINSQTHHDQLLTIPCIPKMSQEPHREGGTKKMCICIDEQYEAYGIQNQNNYLPIQGKTLRNFFARCQKYNLKAL